MGDKSAIQWTDATWNPVTGCSKVSPGCAHCYAESFTRRMASTWNVPDLPWTPENAEQNVILHPERLEQPLKWKRPRMIFVNSMSDLFHERVPDEFIANVFAVMALAQQHIFQVLTKRPERMCEFLTRRLGRGWVTGSYAADLTETAMGHVDAGLLRDVNEANWPLPNVWLGTSIENRRYVGRVDDLRATPAAIRFISAEPLLGPLLPDAEYMTDAEHETYAVGDAPWNAWRPWADGYQGASLSLEEIDWLIVGGESGVGHRPMSLDWVRALRDYCQEECWQGEREGTTAFFYKQAGGVTPKAGGRMLDGRLWDEMPTAWVTA